VVSNLRHMATKCIEQHITGQGWAGTNLHVSSDKRHFFVTFSFQYNCFARCYCMVLFGSVRMSQKMWGSLSCLPIEYDTFGTTIFQSPKTDRPRRWSWNPKRPQCHSKRRPRTVDSRNSNRIDASLSHRPIVYERYDSVAIHWQESCYCGGPIPIRSISRRWSKNFPTTIVVSREGSVRDQIPNRHHCRCRMMIAISKNANWRIHHWQWTDPIEDDTRSPILHRW